jgi:hypothetical protein
MIKTTKKMRELYAKHINKNYIDDFKLHGSGDRKCYMCLAADTCYFCPLDRRFIGGHCVSVGPQTREKRMNWIINNINQYTDCFIEDYL